MTWNTLYGDWYFNHWRCLEILYSSVEYIVCCVRLRKQTIVFPFDSHCFENSPLSWSQKWQTMSDNFEQKSQTIRETHKIWMMMSWSSVMYFLLWLWSHLSSMYWWWRQPSCLTYWWLWWWSYFRMIMILFDIYLIWKHNHWESHAWQVLASSLIQSFFRKQDSCWQSMYMYSNRIIYLGMLYFLNNK